MSSTPSAPVRVELLYAGHVEAAVAVAERSPVVKAGWSGLGAPSSDRVHLAEGSLWDHRSSTLYFIDILGCKLHALHDVGEGQQPSHREWRLPSRPGTVVLTRRVAVLLVACQDGLHYLDTNDGSVTYSGVRADAGESEHRCNDGKTDPSGRLVVGTMHLDEGERGKEKGTLYRLDSSGALTPLLRHLSIPNGLAWSRDGTRFWHTDVHRTAHSTQRSCHIAAHCTQLRRSGAHRQ